MGLRLKVGDHERAAASVKALVKSAPEPGLVLMDVPEPPMGIDDVRIRVHHTGVCGTDLQIDAWSPWAARTINTPLVLGHEFAGEVLEVGTNVEDVAVGDLVSGEGHEVCGRCRHCRQGRAHLCARTVVLGVERPGSFAEQVVLPATNVWRHAPGTDTEVAAIFDPFGNAVHTALSFPILGKDVLVVGGGPIGLMATAVARHAGARIVVVSEPNPVRRELACRMGATRAIDPRAEPLAHVQRDLGIVDGFDVALEMSGNADALRDAFANLAHGGNMAVLGLPSGEVPVDLHALVFNQLTIRGIFGRQMYETWFQASALLASGLDIAPVITHRYGYRDYQEAFAVARRGESAKVIIDWRD